MIFFISSSDIKTKISVFSILDLIFWGNMRFLYGRISKNLLTLSKSIYSYYILAACWIKKSESVFPKEVLGFWLLISFKTLISKKLITFIFHLHFRFSITSYSLYFLSKRKMCSHLFSIFRYFCLCEIFLIENYYFCSFKRR